MLKLASVSRGRVGVAWAGAIVQLQDETELSLVKLWLAVLLGGLEMWHSGGFYDAAGVAIATHQESAEH